MENKFEIPKVIIIDESRWICGEPDQNDNKDKCLGKGISQLQNEQKFMCCLGQATLQLKPDIDREKFNTASSPSNINTLIPYLTEEYGSDYTNTNFTRDCMAINDSSNTTVEQKKAELIRMCKKHKVPFTFQFVKQSENIFE